MSAATITSTTPGALTDALHGYMQTPDAEREARLRSDLLAASSWSIEAQVRYRGTLSSLERVLLVAAADAFSPGQRAALRAFREILIGDMTRDEMGGLAASFYDKHRRAPGLRAP